jgi:hypothetical protein
MTATELVITLSAKASRFGSSAPAVLDKAAYTSSTRDCGTQLRVALSHDVIDKYAERFLRCRLWPCRVDGVPPSR